MPTIRANGLDIAYQVAGDGPPLVLLHGALGAGAAEWAASGAALARSFRVFMPDARGHGATVWDPAQGISIDDLASDVEAFAGALGLGPFHLGGYSLGGVVALRLAIRQATTPRSWTPAGAAHGSPGSVTDGGRGAGASSPVTVGGHGPGSSSGQSGVPGAASWVAGAAPAADADAPAVPRRAQIASLALVACGVARDPAAKVFRAASDPARIVRDDPGWAAELERLHAPQGSGAWRRLPAAIADEIDTYRLPTPAELRAVRVPVLVACGDRDPFVPVHHAVALFRQLPRARLLVMPASGHDVLAAHPGPLADAIGELGVATGLAGS